MLLAASVAVAVACVACAASAAVVIIYVLLSVDQSVGACVLHPHTRTHTSTHAWPLLTYFTIE